VWSLLSLALLNSAMGATSTHSAAYAAGHTTIRVADTFIDSHNDVADGAAVYLNLACLAGAGGFDERILVRFDELVGSGSDQIHVGSQVLSASLTLTPATGSMGFDGQISSAVVGEAWDAPDATWAIRQPATDWTEEGCGAASQWRSAGETAVAAKDSTVSFDLSDAVAAWVEGDVDNHGVVLWCDADVTSMGAPVSFVAHEGHTSGAPGPVLVVEWIGPDNDGDGTDSYSDCHDEDASVGPSASEVPYDGIDQDCDGADLNDSDGDGYTGGDTGDDCDDTNAAIHPDASEVDGDGVDQDCDGSDNSASDTGTSIDTGNDTGGETVGDTASDTGGMPDDSGQPGEVDSDGDRWSVDDGDCDDGDPAIRPGAGEECNGLDDDCDGHTDESCPNDAATGCACSASSPSSRAAPYLGMVVALMGWLSRRRKAAVSPRTSPAPARGRR
jgi:MYXO-CTERM domain-containing protein